MIIASDLDRTLFYSKRAMEELGYPEKATLRPIEKKDGNWIAFMTETAYMALAELCQQCLFVPVTTRTTEQYKRFVIFEKEIPLTYAITSNGANILYKGKPMRDWSEHMLTRMRSESVAPEELRSIIQRQGFHFEGRWKSAENLFFYQILDCSPTHSERKALSEVVAKIGWRISLQGRKLYFIPKAISKGTALHFICNREGKEAIAGAGDSVLDWDFIQNCRYQYIPKHGELASISETTSQTLTNNSGVLAGEEILEKFLTHLSIKI